MSLLQSPTTEVYNMISLAGVMGDLQRDFDAFRFLDLPPELRNMIYRFAFAKGYSAINNTLASHVATIKRENSDCRRGSPGVRRVTPSLLLVCRQVYGEARWCLQEHTLELRHGLLNFQLPDLISYETFRNLTAIFLFDDGHNILDKQLPMSFVGHQRMATEMSAWLASRGHSLQTLDLHFTSPQLKWHLDHCWARHTGCDMRHWLIGVFEAWKEVRGIRKVNIYGWLPEDMKLEMLRLMTSNFSPFSRLPEHILRRIASYSASLHDISRFINRVNHPRRNRAAIQPVKMTPGIFLVNRQLTRQLINHTTPRHFELDLLHRPSSDNWTRDITSYIGPDTLRTVTSIKIHIRHRAWLPLLFDISHILAQSHRLQSFHFDFEDNRRLPAAPTASGLVRSYPDWRLEAELRPLRMIREVERVSFGGDLADPAASVFMGWLQRKMQRRDRLGRGTLVGKPGMHGRRNAVQAI